MQFVFSCKNKGVELFYSFLFLGILQPKAINTGFGNNLYARGFGGILMNGFLDFGLIVVLLFFIVLLLALAYFFFRFKPKKPKPVVVESKDSKRLAFKIAGAK
ncbi:MAG: hypothetical protein QXK06_02965 [Candidatus Diapherotrites archaeon]